MSIYSIPPLLSTIVLFILFVMGICRVRKDPVNLFFALICLIGSFLNLDKTLLTLLENETLMLRISRIDHVFLIFIIPLYLHFTIIVTGYKKWMPLVKIFYIVALFLIPYTQHPLYLTHVQRYFFGSFAMAGPLFVIFGTLSTISVLLSIYLLIKSLRTEKVSIKRTRIKYILLSFGLAAFVNHFDVVIMKGYEIYPIGNFVFIPMSLLAYAIYKHDIMEWKIFLNKGVVFFTLLLMASGTFIGSGVLLKNLLHDSISADIIYILSMIVTFLLVYVAKERVHDFIIQFLQQEFHKKEQAIKELSFQIVRLYHINTIERVIVDRLSSMFHIEKCSIHMVPNLESGEVARFLDEKDSFWYQGYRLALPIHSQSHPSYLLLGEKDDMSLYTTEEINILSILANHIALAFDNATAYKKIQDFSNSLERLVDERTKALIQSESLAAVGRLAAGVAHELNNPIASVMSTLEYYRDHETENKQLSEDLAFSLSELKRAKDIVKSLLDASRQKEETKTLVDIHNPIDDALKILYNQYKSKKIAIIKHFNARYTLFMGNAPRLCQVFINLIKNAIDAIGDREGHIVIETSNSEQRSPDNTQQKVSRHIICTISDNGYGMDRSTLRDIFKPFFTTKPQGKGIGLGLYIVHEIIKDHDGSIEVVSEKGTGTTFTITLPCYQQ